MHHNTKFKQGAASFYIVAIATLILVIMATSFAAIIMSEIARTSNDDLAQSAYDSALAGVEDAKLAYYKYSQCVNGTAGPETVCDGVEEAFKSGDCNSVAEILYGTEGEIKLQESTEGDSNMDQAYTCVKFIPLTDVTGTLFGSAGIKTTQVIKISIQEGEEAKNVASIQMRWGKKTEDGTALPPTLEFGIVQTSSNFKLEDFTMTYGDRTNRGTLFLEPTTVTGNYSVTKSIPASELLKSNDKTAYNHTQQVTCDTEAAADGADGEFLCSVNIELPKPVDGVRSNDTFMVVLSTLSDEIPYNFALCKGENGCETVETNPDGSTKITKNIVPMDMQLAVDSTGRANDLYRRVYTILQPAEQSSSESKSIIGNSEPGHANPYYALSAQEIQKIYYSTCEMHFGSNGAGCGP